MKRKVIANLLIFILVCLSLAGNEGSIYAMNHDTESILDMLFNNEQENEQDDLNKDVIDQNEQLDLYSESVTEQVVEPYYAQVRNEWEDQGIKEASKFLAIIHPQDFQTEKGAVALTPKTNSNGYDEDVLKWDEEIAEINFKVTVPEEGLYQINIDYYSIPGKITPIERAIMINGSFQYFESRRIILPRQWQDESEDFQQDALGNELFSKQKEIYEWQTRTLMDASYFHDQPLLFHLVEGANEIRLVYLQESVYLGKITVQSPEKLPTYEEYQKKVNEDQREAKRVIYEVEAEKPYAKSDSYIQAQPHTDPQITPFRNGLITMNTLGGDSWKEGGQSVTWKITVEEDGLYNLAFKYIQNSKINMPVYRTVMIDGAVPFVELLRYPFQYSKNPKNEVLSGNDGLAYQFYLTAGEHRVTLVANPGPYEPVISAIRYLMEEISNLTLELKMATGNTQDIYRDWEITEQIPDISEQLIGYADELRQQYDYMKALSGQKPDQVRDLIISAEVLEKLAADPESIPYKFEQLSQGTGSVTQRLGNLLLSLPEQALTLDKFYVYANEKLPKATSSFWQKVKLGISRFFSSFTTDYSKISTKEPDALQVWVNRPRQYVMLMQQMVNSSFTEETGIKVSLSLMPAENKLILANAAGQSPDVALGVSTDYPYELALRGALADLTKFPDYESVVQRFAPGALLPFMFNQGTYALPETQNFWVMYYRKDIFDAMNISVPDTWEDVLNILPDLQRYGMNFYVPLANQDAYKSFHVTSPFIYQYGGELFAEDGTRTAIDSEEALEAFKFMTKIFTVYNMPLQVSNFYNHFRDGDLPIGIADYNHYIQLTTAAPELAGWWKIAPYPGIQNEEGEVVRWAPGSGQAAMVFESSDKQQEAWEFIKWWTSTEIQTEFGNTIEMIYGPEYRWNTSNLEAFTQLPWPQEDINIVLEQWRWMKDVAHIPGDYMLNRELSFAWNRVVFDGVNSRQALEDAVVISNREILKKLEEFGYVKDGKVIETIEVPTVTSPADQRWLK